MTTFIFGICIYYTQYNDIKVKGGTVAHRNDSTWYKPCQKWPNGSQYYIFRSGLINWLVPGYQYASNTDLDT